MKKINIYKLFCTTIIIPGLSVAMEGRPEPEDNHAPNMRIQNGPPTPVREASEKIAKVKASIGPSTPNIKQAAQKKADNTNLNPRHRLIFAQGEELSLLADRDKKRNEEIKKIEVERDLKMSEREQKAQAERRENDQKEIQEKLQLLKGERLEKENLKIKFEELEAKLSHIQKEKIQAEINFEKEKAELTEIYEQNADLLANVLEKLSKEYQESKQQLEEKENESRQQLVALRRANLEKERAELKLQDLEKGLVFKEEIEKLTINEPLARKIDKKETKEKRIIEKVTNNLGENEDIDADPTI